MDDDPQMEVSSREKDQDEYSFSGVHLVNLNLSFALEKPNAKSRRLLKSFEVV
jgi:hypothetical protein